MARPRTYSEKLIAEVRHLREVDQLPYRKIADIVGIPRETLRCLMERNGIKGEVPLRSNADLKTYAHIDLMWLAEFRGFVCGEGCVFLVRANRKGYSRPVYQPQLAISLRDDDADILYNIHQTLGCGSITLTSRKPPRGNVVRWSAVGIPNLYNLFVLLADGSLPAKKKREFEIALEYCEARLDMPSRTLNDAQVAILDRYWHCLRELKRY
jgi:hypothetical protein